MYQFVKADEHQLTRAQQVENNSDHAENGGGQAQQEEDRLRVLIPVLQLRGARMSALHAFSLLAVCHTVKCRTHTGPEKVVVQTLQMTI